ncbi:unnamed protein product, partial [Brachionus calyciflorus]
MSKKYLHNKNCAVCERRFYSTEKKRINEVSNENLIKKLNAVSKNTRVVTAGDLVCSRCTTIAYQKSKIDGSGSNIEHNPFQEENELYSNNEPIDPSEEISLDNNEGTSTGLEEKQPRQGEVFVDIPRTTASHRCFVCKMNPEKFTNVKLRVIRIEAIAETFIIKNILIPANSRCCSSHLDENQLLNDEALNQLLTVKNDSKVNKGLLSKFANPNLITEEICMKNSGFEKKDFLIIHDSLKSMRNSNLRTKSQALIVYLFWLKTGLDQTTIGAHFDLCQLEVSRICQQVRESLFKDFVPLNLGPKVKPRIEWLTHNSYISRELFCQTEEQLILVCDGTYCYCERSSNNIFQRSTFCVQKKRHLVKPFVICTTDGFIVDIYGLYEATKNDASILLDIFEKDDELKQLIQPGDILLLDRGFRDCKDILEKEYKLQTKMPSFLSKKEKQFSTLDANRTRLVTKSRWVVEALNAFLRRSFKALSEVKNKSLPHILTDYKIAGAMENRFYRRLFSDNDNNFEIVTNMKKKVSCANELEVFVRDNKFHKKSLFVRLESYDQDDFPKIDEAILKNQITLGTYQLIQGKSYLAEHLNNGKYEIRVNKENDLISNSKILYANIQSRHSKAIKYKVFVKFVPNINEVNAIEGWYCTCKSGMRTVGCCSHIAKSSESENEDDEACVSSDENDIEAHEENILLKRSASLSLNEGLITKKTNNNYSSNDDFFTHVPSWGADFSFKQMNIRLDNTCTIDYYLLGLWFSYKLSFKVIPCLNDSSSKIKKEIIELISLIEQNDWDLV